MRHLCVYCLAACVALAAPVQADVKILGPHEIYEPGETIDDAIAIDEQEYLTFVSDRVWLLVGDNTPTVRLHIHAAEKRIIANRYGLNCFQGKIYQLSGRGTFKIVWNDGSTEFVQILRTTGVREGLKYHWIVLDNVMRQINYITAHDFTRTYAEECRDLTS